MRKSPVSDLLKDRGAVVEERNGVEVVRSFSSFKDEYETVRENVGLTDFSFAFRCTVKEAGLDVFERYAAGSVANIRFGRILHTMAVDDKGMLETELYIANDDEDLILVGESLVGDEINLSTLASLGAEEAHLSDISNTTALFGLDGVKAWAVVKDLFGSDILGLPYLSIETYDLYGTAVKLMRAGKTSEFGYLLLVPSDSAVSVFERIEAAGKPHNLGLVGLDAHMALRLDGRFFNIHEEGARVKDPLPLGLQWMMDLEGDDYRGREALMARRARGLNEKVVGVTAESGNRELKVGETLLHGDETIGSLVSAAHSPTLGRWIGLALLKAPFAYAGLDFQAADGKTVSTISMPPFMAKSLSIRLDEM